MIKMKDLNTEIEEQKGEKSPRRKVRFNTEVKAIKQNLLIR